MLRRFCLFLAGAAFCSTLAGQTITSGDIAGTITDPSGAVLAKVAITLKNLQTSATQVTTTNDRGSYRFSFLQPGDYGVTAELPGFQPTERKTSVAVGQANHVDIQLAIARERTEVTVSEAAGGVQTENANLATTFNSEQVGQMPNPGNDISYIGQAAPGAVMNTQAGYGNFSTFGLPATSNLFTLNGQNDMEPYLSLNNSGATNLTLGSNEIDQATVVNNGYSGQYGGLAGSQVNYVTKSGSNAFHGNAIWWWNGRTMNANNFFNNASGAPRPFDNANQWATSVGGPIWKDHTFFFVDYEGLRVVLPTSQLARIPSPQFQQATLANLNATGQSASVPFYQNMFSLYNSAAGAASATAVPGGGCGAFNGLGGAPCALEFRSTAGNFTHEYVWATRVDQVLGQNDRLFARFQRDNGVQASYTDAINLAFNAFSDQPEFQSQISETHSFGATSVNQLILSGQYYRAKFGPPSIDAQRSVFPTTVRFTGQLFSNLGGEDYLWPQGRNATQYQLVDDFSHIVGNHTFKAGVNFHRSDISDYIFGRYTSGRVTERNLTDFFNGGGSGNSLVMNFPTQPAQPIALYSLGVYGQDEWRVRPSLKLTLALRLDHNSNPVCQTNCFAALTAPFTALNHDPTVPYNQVIQNGLHQALPGLEPLIWEPRIGLTWSPGGSSKTVIRTGFGVFGNTFPANIVDNFARNTPQLNSFTVSNLPLAPGMPNSLFATAAAANQSLLQAFNSGGTLASISAANRYFVTPGFTTVDRGTVKQARFYEWNFEVQRQLPGAMVASFNYVGNHGIYIPTLNDGVNAYCDPGTCPGGFLGLPTAAPDQRFGTVTQIMSTGVSRYNGLTASLSRRMSHGLLFQLNYTFSHALDSVSNGGVDPFSESNTYTSYSLLNPQDPNRIRAYNYGNADYDVRHYFSASYVWDNPLRHLTRRGPNALLSDWTISGTVFTRSGLPFTVLDGAATSALNALNYGGVVGLGGGVFADVAGSGATTCGPSGVNTSCFSASQFGSAQASPTHFGAQSRNQFRGPMYFNTDLSVSKLFRIPRWETARLGFGAQFFNLFNHPNFDVPISDITDPLFGTITNTVSPPTSIVGSFLGGDASPRMIQVKLQLRF
jgi:hypothetical protein